MLARTREIGDAEATRLRVTISSHPSGAMICIERCDQRHRPSVLLSLYGAEILSGFIMSARLSLPHPMPDETTEGTFCAHFHLERSPAPRVIVERDDAFPLIIDSMLWDRLYAELCLVIAHGRELARRAGVSLH